jgi:hypothetical protein
MADASQVDMLYLVFGHTAEEPTLRVGPMPSFKVGATEIVDHAGEVLARHNGQRWTVHERAFYRVDCEGPVLVHLEGARPGAAPLGPFEHFSLFNGTAYASRDVFAQYNEQDRVWHLHGTDEHCLALRVTPG